MDNVTEAVAALYECPLPTVAAIDGPAFSEGACLALACDVRLASPDGAIGFGFRRFGQAPSAGATYLLPQIVGPDVAAELLYTGKLLDAQRASDLGLFSSVVGHEQFSDVVSGLLSELATGPPAALQATKKLLRSETADIRETIDSERQVQTRLAETADFEEGVTAFAQQRGPQF
jgi:enoyl-CoA hydratase/carnithine racemase